MYDEWHLAERIACGIRIIRRRDGHVRDRLKMMGER